MVVGPASGPQPSIGSLIKRVRRTRFRDTSRCGFEKRYLLVGQKQEQQTA